MSDPAFRAFQREFFQALRDRPLDVQDPDDAKLYVPLHDQDTDPVVRLHDTIDFSIGESVQLVAGFRGTGKTTEFSRLEKRLWASDYLVVRVDLDEYLDLHTPIAISDFLLVLAGAVSDCLVDERLLGPEEGLQRSFWERIIGLLGGRPALEKVGLRAGALSLQMGLRSDPTLRQAVRTALEGQLPRLVQEVRRHHEEVLEALCARWGDDARLVVIVDSLEHIRGDGHSAEQVYRSIEDLFFGHARHLQLPTTHMVLSVPAFLALHADNLAAQFVNGAVQAWSSVMVVDRTGTPVPQAVERLATMIDRRGDWRRVLPDRAALDKLVLASGGYLRDLLNMMVEAIHLAGGGVTIDQAERIIAVARRSYQPLYADEVRVLKRIAEARDVSAITSEERGHLLRFLDSHLVLCYLDEAFWYDVHPLVREYVLGRG
jgi:hypothetical protein